MSAWKANMLRAHLVFNGWTVFFIVLALADIANMAWHRTFITTVCSTVSVAFVLSAAINQANGRYHRLRAEHWMRIIERQYRRLFGPEES